MGNNMGAAPAAMTCIIAACALIGCTRHPADPNAPEPDRGKPGWMSTCDYPSAWSTAPDSDMDRQRTGRCIPTTPQDTGMTLSAIGEEGGSIRVSYRCVTREVTPMDRTSCIVTTWTVTWNTATDFEFEHDVPGRFNHAYDSVQMHRNDPPRSSSDVDGHTDLTPGIATIQ